jgi:hypothetical protein
MSRTCSSMHTTQQQVDILLKLVVTLTALHVYVYVCMTSAMSASLSE